MLRSSDDGLEWDVQVSPILETLFGMRSLLTGWRDDPWIGEAVRSLGDAYVTELGSVFGPFREGLDLFEVAIGTQPTASVEEFAETAREMDAEEFLFYVHGRILPQGSSHDELDPAEMRHLFEHYGDYEHYVAQLAARGAEMPGGSWSAYGPVLRDRLVGLTLEFWNRYLAARWPDLCEANEAAVRTNRAYAEEFGPLATHSLITEYPGLPPMVPDNVPTTRVLFYPVVHCPNWGSSFVYDGEASVVFRSDRTPVLIEEFRAEERRTLTIAKALADKTRLSMLRMVYMHDGVMNGRNLAAKFGLAKSVISKHMRQLIDAGLIREESPDNRNTIYFSNRDTIRGYSSALAEALGGPIQR